MDNFSKEFMNAHRMMRDLRRQFNFPTSSLLDKIALIDRSVKVMSEIMILLPNERVNDLIKTDVASKINAELESLLEVRQKIVACIDNLNATINP